MLFAFGVYEIACKVACNYFEYLHQVMMSQAICKLFGIIKVVE